MGRRDREDDRVREELARLCQDADETPCLSDSQSGLDPYEEELFLLRRGISRAS